MAQKAMMSLEDHILDIQKKLQNNEYPNEQSISQGIVLRLLEALQWPRYEPQVIYAEYPIEGTRVDFALCVKKNKPLILIEVKRPGEPLDNNTDAQKQLFQYAYHVGIPFIILLDGKEWHFYLPAEVGSYNERRVYKLDLIERDPKESVYRLERYLSFNEVAGGKALENAREDYKNVSREREAKANISIAWEKLLEEKDELLIEVVSEKVESICGFKPSQKEIITHLESLKSGLVVIPRPPAGGNEGAYPAPPKSTAKLPKSPGLAKIKVTFPDGVEICQSKVADTMVEVIRRIGFEKVKSLGMEMYGCPIVSNQKYKQEKYNWSEAANGIYVFTHSSTDKKLSQLNEINDGLALGLKIEKL